MTWNWSLNYDPPQLKGLELSVMIDNVMNKDTHPYFAAAFYYLENGKDLNKALDWFNKAIAQDPTAYFAVYQKARCLAKLGRKQDGEPLGPVRRYRAFRGADAERGRALGSVT